MPAFQLIALDPEPFAPLFEQPDDVLRTRGMMRLRADSAPGYPCRVSLEDASVGEELLLLPYAHLDGPSPYQTTGPILVRRGARRKILQPGEVPPCITRRLISVRAYDAAGMMIDADVCDGEVVAARIDAFFANADARFIHLHNARPGCFACRVERVAIMAPASSPP